jgi:hypothetical protein
MLLIHRYKTPFSTGPSLHFTALYFTSPTINTLRGTLRFNPFTPDLIAKIMTLLLALVKNPQSSLTQQFFNDSLLSAMHSTFILQEPSVILKRWKNSFITARNWIFALCKVRMLDKGLLMKILGPTGEEVKIGNMKSYKQNIHDLCAST